MSEHIGTPEVLSGLPPLTPERIEEKTGFRLYAIYTEFARDGGIVSPDVYDDRERMAERFGEDNALPSFFMDKDGVVQLGLFVKRPGNDTTT